MPKTTFRIDDREYPPSWCDRCKHLQRDLGLYCAAFPPVKGSTGIPREFLFRGIKHDRPYAGDHGIRFEPVEEGK
ncbi:hypothetical protein GX586_16045 [bacterium]|nr:hypothetical protein [bacterium]